MNRCLNASSAESAGDQNLERHGAVEPLVVGTEDYGHPALADLLFQQVTGYASTRREATRWPWDVLRHRASKRLWSGHCVRQHRFFAISVSS